ncbi:MAG: ATP-binding protein [Candidatus Omnitrophica bacterium]|nr:ATP-binding protein [Candidatus Omnitrophota bacterium]
MFLKSIRFKITILYMAILAVTLAAISIALYHNVDNSLYGNMDTLLKSKAAGIAQAIDTYWEASKLEVIDSGVKPDEVRKRRNVNFAKIAQRWVKKETSDPRLMDIFVQVFDTDGATIASSIEAKDMPTISRKNFITVLQGKTRFDTLGDINQSDRESYRVFTTPIFEKEKVAYIVQVASPLTSIHVALNSLRAALLLILPATVLLTGVMGAFLAKVALHPVDSMIDTIHQITAENMKLKLSIPDTRDEIQKLAETFNSMLGRLESSFNAQRQLFENLSHDLKTPLTILKGEFEVVLKKMRSQGEYESILKSALQEVNKIIKLAENLLFLAKFDSSQMMPEKKRLELGQLLNDVMKNVKTLSELKNIRISLGQDDKPLFLYGDENQLKTLFLNIIDNAVKYTEPGGRIEIVAVANGDLVTVKISDTGVGISREEIGHIFDRFYCVDKSRADDAGFGLGLSIARSIAETHNGRIDVKSEVSKGSTFTVSLPSFKNGSA